MGVGETRAAGTEGQRRGTLKGEIGRLRLGGDGVLASVSQTCPRLSALNYILPPSALQP